MQGIHTPVIIIYPRHTEYYPSVISASKATGISRWRLFRGLADPYGQIPSTSPTLYIDEAVEPPREA